MKKLFKVMAAAACALSLTACGGSSKKSDTLVVGAEELTGTFSPLYYTGAYDGYVIDLCTTNWWSMTWMVIYSLLWQKKRTLPKMVKQLHSI